MNLYNSETTATQDLHIKTYVGQIYTDDYLVKHFPIKYKKQERLQQLHSLIMFLAHTYNTTTVKRNGGIFFTNKTFEMAGIHIKNHVEIHRWIEGLENCGIISCSNPHYVFASTDKNVPNKKKLYHFNDIGIIKSFKEEYFSYKLPLDYVGSSKKEKGTSKKVKDISENVRLKSIKNAKANILDSDDALIKKMTKNTWDDFLNKLEEYNKGLDAFNKKRMTIKISNDKVTGRAYSPYISTKNDESSSEETARTIWKNKYNLKYHYDINSAVPRISYLMNTGIWMPNSFDFYSAIAERTGIKLTRENLKPLFFRFRFGKSKSRSFNAYIYSNKNKFYNNVKPEDVASVKKLLRTEWDSIYDAVEYYCGTDHSSDVFYFESYLELCVTLRLKKMGINCYNVYDEFYYDKPCDIESVIEDCAKYVYNEVNKND